MYATPTNAREARKSAQALLMGTPGTHLTGVQKVALLTEARDLLNKAIEFATAENAADLKAAEEQAATDAEFNAMIASVLPEATDAEALKKATLDLTGAEDVKFVADDEDDAHGSV